MAHGRYCLPPTRTSQGPDNTEFSGEAAAVPSLVRCNSLFAGGYDARLTEARTASGRSTATKRLAANR
jgi:hypothetical protein